MSRLPDRLPDWLADPALGPAWDRIRHRFEATGQAYGRVVLRVADRDQRHAVGTLLGRTLTRESVRIDLAVLDERLRERSGLGGLREVLTAVLGRAPRDRVAVRAQRQLAREEPLALAGSLVEAPWVPEWVAGLRRSGLLTSRPDAAEAIRAAASVLNRLAGGEPGAISGSRVELGARLLGDSHALDRDRLVHQLVIRGLAASAGIPVPNGSLERERLWAEFGVQPDLLSRTCLTRGLRPAGDSPVAVRLRIAADAGDPVHVTQWDLRRFDSFEFMSGVRVLVCENPRVVEAIAEQAIQGWAAVCTSGEPNLVVQAVLRRLAGAGARLSYHGDFDWPGIAIANRVIDRFGARPWRMSAADYLTAVRPDGPPLGSQQGPVTPSWDEALGAAMRSHQRAVHEESVLPGMLAGMVSDMPATMVGARASTQPNRCPPPPGAPA